MIKHQKGGKISKFWRADAPPHSGARTLGLLDCEERLSNLARRIGRIGLVRYDGEAAEHGG